MRLIAVAVLGVAAFVAMSGEASARNGCGRGFYSNGVACVPMARRYAPRRYGPYQGSRLGTFNGCPPHYTVQDGRCKPYRGF